jgi:hypothetical protein
MDVFIESCKIDCYRDGVCLVNQNCAQLQIWKLKYFYGLIFTFKVLFFCGLRATLIGHKPKLADKHISYSTLRDLFQKDFIKRKLHMSMTGCSKDMAVGLARTLKTVISKPIWKKDC